jgi:uncharacterized protein YjbI with pentapeptide repeats
VRRMALAVLAAASVAMGGCSLTNSDHSGAIAQNLKTSSKVKSLIQQTYGGTANVTSAHCTRSGSSQNYACTVDYTVSGANDPRVNGSYALPASATCNSSANCQWQTEAVVLAKRIG